MLCCLPCFVKLPTATQHAATTSSQQRESPSPAFLLTCYHHQACPSSPRSQLSLSTQHQGKFLSQTLPDTSHRAALIRLSVHLGISQVKSTPLLIHFTRKHCDHRQRGGHQQNVCVVFTRHFSLLIAQARWDITDKSKWRSSTIIYITDIWHSGTSFINTYTMWRWLVCYHWKAIY